MAPPVGEKYSLAFVLELFEIRIEEVRVSGTLTFGNPWTFLLLRIDYIAKGWSDCPLPQLTDEDSGIAIDNYREARESNVR